MEIGLKIAETAHIAVVAKLVPFRSVRQDAEPAPTVSRWLPGTLVRTSSAMSRPARLDGGEDLDERGSCSIGSTASGW